MAPLTTEYIGMIVLLPSHPVLHSCSYGLQNKKTKIFLDCYNWVAILSQTPPGGTAPLCCSIAVIKLFLSSLRPFDQVKFYLKAQCIKQSEQQKGVWLFFPPASPTSPMGTKPLLGICLRTICTLQRPLDLES